MAGLFDFLNVSPAGSAAPASAPDMSQAGIYPNAAPAAPSSGGLFGGLQMPSWLGGTAGIANNGYAAYGGGAGGGSAMAGPLFWAALIGAGKNVEQSNANNGIGMTLQGGLAPSASQIAKDPMGMGLPTLLGMPFLTPFTGSKAARDTKPEWSSLFRLGQY